MAMAEARERAYPGEGHQGTFVAEGMFQQGKAVEVHQDLETSPYAKKGDIVEAGLQSSPDVSWRGDGTLAAVAAAGECRMPSGHRGVLSCGQESAEQRGG
jgi:hypothetical protein